MATRRRRTAGARKAITRGRAKPARGAARFRSLTQLSSDWYWEQDAEFRLTFMSSYVGDESGLDASAYLGRKRWEQPALNLTDADWERHRAQLERRQPFRDFEIQRAAGDGHSVWMSLSGEPVFDGRGRFKGYRGVGRDITVQKRGEQLLRLEHSVTRSLAEASSPPHALRQAMRWICETESWDCAEFWKLDEAAGVLRRLVHWAMPGVPEAERFVERSRDMAFGPGIGLVGSVWQSGEPLWIADSRQDPRAVRKELSDETGLGAALLFPIPSGPRAVAVLAFTCRSIRAPDERLLQALNVIAAQIGQFLQRAQAEESQRESELRFRSLVQMSSDFFWETDAQDHFTEIVQGPTYVDTIASAGEAGWGELRGMFQARSPFRDFEFGRPWPDGSIRYFSVSGEPRFAADGAFLGYRGVGRDITEIALARERIASLAYSDPLTGLANRTSLSPALEQAVERARRRGAKLACVFMDLDGFKQINDAHGHDIGDGLLIDVARRLRTVLRASDFLARLGGDEFFVVIEDVHDVPAVDGIARKLLSELLEPYQLAGDKRAQITASLGVSVFPDDAGDAQTLMKHADMAMYAAKQAGKNSYRFHPVEPVGEASYERTSPRAA
jgi:diguanylate cyclase (GGDEF)-like protein/PAS domain S-box-containing protein